MISEVDETQRLNVLRRYGVLDTPPEEIFERVVRMAATMFHAPIATVTFVDEARQWFKAVHGLDVRETGRDVALCHYTIMQDDVMVVLDATKDDRFRNNPLVTRDPNIRFYAGAPLIASGGWRLGTVSVIDRKPRRQVPQGQRQFLRDLAAQVIHDLEVRLAARDYRQEIERRQVVERELDLANSRFRLAIANSPVILCASDRDLRYTWTVNLPPPLRDVDFIGKCDTDLWPTEMARELTALKRQALEERRVVRGEVRMTIEGRELIFDATYEPLYERGRVVGTSGAAFDITDRIEAQNSVNRSLERAKTADAAKGMFLAAASHDLRQPVQSLFLLLGVLRSKLKDHPASKVAETAHEALEALRGLLDDLLDISRLEAGLVVPKQVPVPLQPLISRLACEAGIQAAAKNLRFHHLCRDKTVLSDPVLLERILRNLIDNAVRYTDSGGVLLGCRAREGTVRIEVIDTGHGIPTDRMEQVFEEFTQLENPERDRRKGLGLGLAIVRRLSTLLGHRLDVRSRPGRGTCFALTLPALPAVLPTVEPASLRQFHGRVLVIDDESQVAQSLAIGLEQAGLTVLTAGSADDAVAQLSGSPPDAILADLRLRGGQTGLDAVARIRAFLGEPIPAVLITGDTSPERLAMAEASGCTLLHKPVPLEKLLMVVGRVLPAQG